MKVFGKKTVAMIMAIAMMLSLCCVNVNAATVSTAKPTAIEIKAGKTTIGVGEVLELSIESDGSPSVTWSTSSKSTASVGTTGKVTGKKAGEVTITAKSKKDSKVTDTIEIEVKAITEIEFAEDVTVGYGTSKSTVEDILNAMEVEKIYGSGADESYMGKFSGEWDCDDYDKNEPGTYTFVLDDEDVEGEVDVIVDDITLMDEEDKVLDPIYVPKGTKVSSVKLPTTVSLLLNNKATEQDLTVGTKTSNHFQKWVCDEVEGLTKFDEVDTYTYTAEANEKDNYDLPDLTLQVIVYDNEVSDITLDADNSYVYLDDAVDAITDKLNDLFGSEAELHHIDFTKITGYNEEKETTKTSWISGTLYTDGDCVTKVETGDDPYTAEALGEMCFVANGKGHDTIYEYTAYADEEGKQAVKGRIVIESEQFMILEMEVSNSETLDFVSSEFSSAFKSLDSDNTLVYVEFDNELDSDEGELYYKYGSSKYEEEVYNEAYYVKADADEDEWDLDDVTFVPDEDAEGIVTIEFVAYGYYDGDKDDEIEAAGVLQINILDEANIVITAGIEEKVPVDLELFKEYLDDEADTEKIAYIVFDGAPYTTGSGYLIAGSKSFKDSGDKEFHMDPEKDEYDLEDLYFMGGEDKGVKRAEFEIYYYDGKEVEDDPVTGTVDFVTDVSVNIYTKTPMKASTVLKFSSSITAFEKVGGQTNEYFKFTSLPEDGKLYYNFGLSTQEDVKTDVAYYLGTVSGSKKALKNITFVPSYSSVKKQQTITFDYKAYDKDDNYVAGSCFFEVQYANKSDYFSDITTGVYADSVDFLKNQGITTGVPGGKYDANGSLTRAQVVTFLYRAAGEPAVSGTTTFKDIVKGEYYYNAVLWASKTGVTKGRDAYTFDPNATVTNAEVIQFMYNFDVLYLKHSYASGSTSIVTDYSNVASWAQTAVKWATGKGVLTSGYLYPANVGTRGNIALYLHRMLTL